MLTELEGAILAEIKNGGYETAFQVRRAFATSLSLEWKGSGIEEQGIDAVTGAIRVQVDPRYFRPTEVDFLLGDPAKAKARLGWSHTTGFRDLVAEMVQADLARAAGGTRQNSRSA